MTDDASLSRYETREPWLAIEEDGSRSYAILRPGDVVRYGMVWQPKGGGLR